jgi:hypothetical protein
MNASIKTLKNCTKLLIFILMASILVFMLAAPAMASPGVQEWYLDSISSQASSACKIMTKTYNVSSGSVVISSGATQIWLADQQAQAEVPFPNGSWVIQLKTDTDWGDSVSSKCVMKIGQWNTSTGFASFQMTQAGQVIYYDPDTHILRIEMQVGPEKVDKGNYLALSIENQDSGDHTISTDGASSVKSPNSDPGYPLPETAAVVLLGAGIVGVLGYIGIRRVKTSMNNK